MVSADVVDAVVAQRVAIVRIVRELVDVVMLWALLGQAKQTVVERSHPNRTILILVQAVDRRIEQGALTVQTAIATQVTQEALLLIEEANRMIA